MLDCNVFLQDNRVGGRTVDSSGQWDFAAFKGVCCRRLTWREAVATGHWTSSFSVLFLFSWSWFLTSARSVLSSSRGSLFQQSSIFPLLHRVGGARQLTETHRFRISGLLASWALLRPLLGFKLIRVRRGDPS